MTIDLFLLGISALGAFALRLSDVALPPSRFFPLLMIAPVLGVASAFAFGIYRHVTRIHSSYNELRLTLSQLAAAVLYFAIVLIADQNGFPRSLPIIHFLLSTFLMIAIRRTLTALVTSEGKTMPKRHRTSVAIFGADATGLALLTSLERQGKMNIVAFLDDDPSFQRRRIHGRRVFPLTAISKLLVRYSLVDVYIAKRGISRQERQRIVETLEKYSLGIHIVPGLDEIASGDVAIQDTRVISAEDLLGRDPVPPRQELFDKAIRGKTVLVTGAGGSIGSELVRQILLNSPKQIILLDHHEHALFTILQRLERDPATKNVQITSLLGSICDVSLIKNMFASFAVDTVYHAAAYKHVGLVQQNIFAGAVNNIIGTEVLATEAKNAGVKLFTLVSTDKAVRPTGAMGASKRVAEIIVQGLAAGCDSTVFTMVRFGNVLGSSGSVVPIFEKQIAAGGPVTVTHRDVIRYFMLISEAAQLVVQASAMAKGGEVFLLDMGDPVKIYDLAKLMIRLAGRTLRDEDNPDGDIEIQCTGLKPGEKLYEELLIGGDIIPTDHVRIFRSEEELPDSKKFATGFARLCAAIEARNAELCLSELMSLAAPRSLESSGTGLGQDSSLLPKVGKENTADSSFPAATPLGAV